METQCNFCGSFEKLTTCAHCESPVCARCYLGHEPTCKELSKRRAVGAGQTVRELRIRQNDAPPLPPEEKPTEVKVEGGTFTVETIRRAVHQLTADAMPADTTVDPFVAAGVKLAESVAQTDALLEQNIRDASGADDASERSTIQ